MTQLCLISCYWWHCLSILFMLFIFISRWTFLSSPSLSCAGVLESWVGSHDPMQADPHAWQWSRSTSCLEYRWVFCSIHFQKHICHPHQVFPSSCAMVSHFWYLGQRGQDAVTLLKSRSGYLTCLSNVWFFIRRLHDLLPWTLHLHCPRPSIMITNVFTGFIWM